MTPKKSKLLISLGLGLVLGTIIFASAPSYSVGDKMPNFSEGYAAYNFGIWLKNGKKGMYTRWDRKDTLIGVEPNQFYTSDGKVDYLEVRLICNGEIMKTPFGVSDFKYVYLDKNFDGYIDGIEKAKGRDISEDAPNCP